MALLLGAGAGTSAEEGGGYRVVPLAATGSIVGTCSLERAVPRPKAPVGVQPRAPTPSCGCGDPMVGPSDRVLAHGLLLADCVVQVEGIRAGKDWPEPVRDDERLAQVVFRGCRYEPHVQWLRAGTQVAILHGEDVCEVNAHLYREDGSTQANFGVAPRVVMADVAQMFLTLPGVYALRCDMHPGLNASLVVVDHPYVAGPTRIDGRYRIDDVPPGTHDVVCWHEGWDATPQVRDGRVLAWRYDPDVRVRRSVTVVAGETARLDFVLPVAASK
jgi:hypothetical protein